MCSAGIANVYPEPADKKSFILNAQYNDKYAWSSALPAVYDWPNGAGAHISNGHHHA